MKPCPYPIEELLVHAPPMILLDRVEAFDEKHVRAGLQIRADSPFIRDGQVPAYISVEYMAQAIAAFSGLQAREENQNLRVGFLLGTRKLKLHASDFFIGDELTINVTAEYNDGEMAAFDCETLRDGRILAEATISVFQPDNLEQFLAHQTGG